MLALSIIAIAAVAGYFIGRRHARALERQAVRRALQFLARPDSLQLLDRMAQELEQAQPPAHVE